ncbi:MAG: hypothetical protein JSS10_05350 [Verrucomicrobia bacterium]|nr:hypothetical protein [Verrucomicrobiota bacterium]
MNKKAWFVFFSFILSYFATAYSTHSTLIAYPNFYENPLLDETMRRKMAPYLLPLDHPIKEKLDILFSSSRVTQSRQTLAAAGFVKVGPVAFGDIMVVRHPEMPGYIFKFYLDAEPLIKEGVANWAWLVRRCKAARAIKKVIKKKKLKYFTVPDKWLYILPSDPRSEEPNSEPIILVETYFELHPNSAKIWKTEVKEKHLDELYTIYQSGYGSIHVPKNVPYTSKRKFAFIDTENPKRKVDVKYIKRYLSKEMGEYWQQKIQGLLNGRFNSIDPQLAPTEDGG